MMEQEIDVIQYEKQIMEHEQIARENFYLSKNWEVYKQNKVKALFKEREFNRK